MPEQEQVRVVFTRDLNGKDSHAMRVDFDRLIHARNESFQVYPNQGYTADPINDSFILERVLKALCAEQSGVNSIHVNLACGFVVRASRAKPLDDIEAIILAALRAADYAPIDVIAEQRRVDEEMKRDYEEAEDWLAERRSRPWWRFWS